jgi:hypothetical protein
MARVTMYLEIPVKGEHKRYEQLCDTLQSLVEAHELDGYFTLTFNEEPCVQPDHRPDLSQLADAIAEAQGFPNGK